jgi:hypothetical protein
MTMQGYTLQLSLQAQVSRILIAFLLAWLFWFCIDQSQPSCFPFVFVTLEHPLAAIIIGANMVWRALPSIEFVYKELTYGLAHVCNTNCTHSYCEYQHYCKKISLIDLIASCVYALFLIYGGISAFMIGMQEGGCFQGSSGYQLDQAGPEEELYDYEDYDYGEEEEYY